MSQTPDPALPATPATDSAPARPDAAPAEPASSAGPVVVMPSTLTTAPDAGAVTDADDGPAPVPAPRPRHSWRGLLMASPPILLLLAFIGFPIVLAVLYSLGYAGGLNSTTARIAQHQFLAKDGHLTLAAYKDMFANSRFRKDLGVTLWVTLVTTVTVLLLALVISLYLRLRGGWAAKALTVLSVIPQFIPVVIASWAVLMFYEPQGFVRSLCAQLGFTGPTFGYTITGVILGQVWVSLPFAVLMCASGVQGVPDALIESARDAGARLPRVIWSIILPMAFVPIVIAATFTAIGVIGSFTVPYFTGPNAPTMLGVDMANYFTAYNQAQQSVVQGVVVFLAALAIAVFYVWANFRGASEPRTRRRRGTRRTASAPGTPA